MAEWKVKTKLRVAGVATISAHNRAEKDTPKLKIKEHFRR